MVFMHIIMAYHQPSMNIHTTIHTSLEVYQLMAAYTYMSSSQ